MVLLNEFCVPLIQRDAAEEEALRCRRQYPTLLHQRHGHDGR
ncbi:hypothetical protein SS05631_b60600 (plasmid) [Sinorhizobium sp. CCBAU 05631]|nr:hypothetical protein SS05631_b60600 [Sinorhizobium sp. CCBAU 05631]